MTGCSCHDAGVDQPTYRCEKHQIEMCDACLHCKDPDLYCKFRSACMIHFIEKETDRCLKRKNSAVAE